MFNIFWINFRRIYEELRGIYRIINFLCPQKFVPTLLKTKKKKKLKIVFIQKLLYYTKVQVYFVP